MDKLVFAPTTQQAPPKQFKDVSGWIPLHLLHVVCREDNLARVKEILSEGYVFSYKEEHKQGYVRVYFPDPEYVVDEVVQSLKFTCTEIAFVEFDPQFRLGNYAALVFNLTGIDMRQGELSQEQVRLISYALTHTSYNPLWETGLYFLTDTFKHQMKQMGTFEWVDLDRQAYEGIRDMFNYYAAHDYVLTVGY